MVGIDRNALHKLGDTADSVGCCKSICDAVSTSQDRWKSFNRDADLHDDADSHGPRDVMLVLEDPASTSVVGVRLARTGAHDDNPVELSVSTRECAAVGVGAMALKDMCGNACRTLSGVAYKSNVRGASAIMANVTNLSSSLI